MCLIGSESSLFGDRDVSSLMRGYINGTIEGHDTRVDQKPLERDDSLDRSLGREPDRENRRRLAAVEWARAATRPKQARAAARTGG